MVEYLSLINDKGFQKIQSDWHQQELQYRDEERFRREIEDARRAANESAEQLKAVGSLSALIAGFAMVVQTNVALDDPTLDSVLLCALALTTALVVSLMLYAMVQSTLILVCIFRWHYEIEDGAKLWREWSPDCGYDRDMHSGRKEFKAYWNMHHAANWQSAYSTFCMGVSAFIALLAVVGWVVFWSHQSKFYSAGIVTLCAIVLLFAWSVLNGKYAHLHYSNATDRDIFNQHMGEYDNDSMLHHLYRTATIIVDYFSGFIPVAYSAARDRNRSDSFGSDASYDDINSSVAASSPRRSGDKPRHSPRHSPRRSPRHEAHNQMNAEQISRHTTTSSSNRSNIYNSSANKHSNATKSSPMSYHPIDIRDINIESINNTPTHVRRQDGSAMNKKIISNTNNTSIYRHNVNNSTSLDTASDVYTVNDATGKSHVHIKSAPSEDLFYNSDVSNISSDSSISNHSDHPTGYDSD